MASMLSIYSLFLLLLRLGQLGAFTPRTEPTRRPRCQQTGTSPTARCATSVYAESVPQRLQYGMAKMESVMSPDFFLQSPVLKQFYTKLIKSIEVRDSLIPGAGRGLFAKKAIKANTIVSFYPAHALGVDSNSPFVVAPPPSASVDDESNLSATYFATHASSQSDYLHCTDQPIFGRPSLIANLTSDPLYLDVNPHISVADGWLSQMINDGAMIHNLAPETNVEAAVLDYYRETKRTKNCIHIPFGPSPILATVTTKRVAPGEELLTTYGGTYWLGTTRDTDNVEITPAIQAEIRESAQDLFRSMQLVSVLYTNQVAALQSEFNKLP